MTASPPERAWIEHFLVCGLSAEGLQTVAGDIGYLGSKARYKPSVTDQLPHSSGNDSNSIPPQLPTCCLPSGVSVVLKLDQPVADLSPKAYTVVLTEGDGTKQYASCVSFYEDVPADLAARHEELTGALALKCICLLTHLPHTSTAERLLTLVHQLCFVTGPPAPLVDVVLALLKLPCPSTLKRPVSFDLAGERFTLPTPDGEGPPASAPSYQPLLEALSPANLTAIFAAVVLERRVLLRASQYRLLTHTAEALCCLLWPFKFQHVYIPIMPYSLVDYLEAPTPYLMGIHSSVELDSRVLEGVLIVDLDRDEVKNGDSLKTCLAHPLLVQLCLRLQHLMRPSSTDMDSIAAAGDPLICAAREMSAQPWSPAKQRLLQRTFVQLFADALRGFDRFLTAPGNVPYRRRSGAGPMTAAEGPVMSRATSFTARVDTKAMMQAHKETYKGAKLAFMKYLMQSLAFFNFVEQYATSRDPYSWTKAAMVELNPFHSGPPGPLPVNFCIGGPPPLGVLTPPTGCVYRNFPALIYTETGADGAIKLRRNSTRGRSRKRNMGKRRAHSELMGGVMDLKRKSPLLDDPSPRGGRLRAIDLVSPTGNNVQMQQLSTAPSSGMLSGESSSSAFMFNPQGALRTPSSSGGNAPSNSSGLQVDYLVEVDLVRRQTAEMLQLMTPATAADGADVVALGSAGEGSGTARGSTGLDPRLEEVRDLLRIQTGGNAWFLVSRMTEELSSCSRSNSACGTPTRSGGRTWRTLAVHATAFSVLADMFHAILDAAVAADDYRVIHALLQLAHHVAHAPAHEPARRLIRQLGANPLVHHEWFWISTFGFAVSSAYLGDEQFLDLRVVVTQQLTVFARHMAGLGVSNSTAWLLLNKLAHQHTSHAPLPTEVLMALRAHLANLETCNLESACPRPPPTDSAMPSATSSSPPTETPPGRSNDAAASAADADASSRTTRATAGTEALPATRRRSSRSTAARRRTSVGSSDDDEDDWAAAAAAAQHRRAAS